ncbi:methyltransferase domain-containing protein [Aureivirga sp. CE67]|uniref:methyltransferase domain-containing protein n=1 Tax=Aureivirga sp. CE67 TaxID=1788983 RepID=UPI0018CB451D|nr:methyltransferase domain-containing protein [Aureivirga sp. CE67]
MSTTNLTKDYWENRYIENEIGWDIGEISRPIKEYTEQLSDKNLKILIPGAGNAHEATFLHQNGFKNVFILDIAEQPLENFKKKNPDFPDEHMIHSDLFHFENSFDLILEQTFFCALSPTLREKYVEKMYSLLKPKGKLVGLLFNTFEENTNPPFGGNKNIYKLLFEKHFHLETMEVCYNSITPRHEKELFFIAKPK